MRTSILIMIPIRIIAQIIIYIVSAVVTVAATGNEDFDSVVDERDKMIELKATRNSYYAFASGFVVSALGLAIGMPVYGIFIAFVAFGLVAEIIDNVSQIYYYRKGV